MSNENALQSAAFNYCCKRLGSFMGRRESASNCLDQCDNVINLEDVLTNRDYITAISDGCIAGIMDSYEFDYDQYKEDLIQDVYLTCWELYRSQRKNYIPDVMTLIERVYIGILLKLPEMFSTGIGIAQSILYSTISVPDDQGNYE